MPKYLPTGCPKCGADLPKRLPKGGRPSRWCSEGCQRSGEAEMSRLQSLLRKLESELYNGGPPMRLEWVAGAIRSGRPVMTIWRVRRRNDRPGYHRGSRVSLIR
jgi:hypothetical protein